MNVALRSLSMLAALALAACGGKTHAKEPQPVVTTTPVPDSAGGGPVTSPSTGRMSITFSPDGAIAINGQTIPRAWREADFTAVLGPPDRTVVLANDLMVYDNLGVVVYRSQSADHIVALAVFFGQMDYEFMPKTLYQGDLTITGQRFDGTLSEDQVHDMMAPRGGDTAYDEAASKPYFSFDDATHKLTVVEFDPHE